MISSEANISITGASQYGHAWTPLFAPRAVAHIKALRGGAQAHLLRCDDNQLYAVKLRNNPQGHRILANEWIGAAVAQYAGIETPDVTPVWIDQDFVRATPQLAIRLGNRSLPIEPGYHFGSRWAGDEQHDPYDYLPDTLLAKVANLPDFRGILIIDKLHGNADSRQCVFVHRDGTFRAHFIDFGYFFNGPYWDYPDHDLTGVYCRPLVYDQLASLADLEPWLSLIEHMPLSVYTDAIDTMPADWLAPEDRAPLAGLVRTAHARRRNIRRSLADLLTRRRATHFPSWQAAAAA
jgi:hypothetical protein